MPTLMPLHIIIPGKTITGRCHVCHMPFFDGETERTMVRHMKACAQDHYERTKPRRDALAIPHSDPEFAEWIEGEYRAGRIKPSTKPV